MATDCTTRLTLDIAVLAAISAVIIYYSYIAVPRNTGFYCNDSSLAHPFLESTVPSWLLYVMASVIPFVVVALGEWLRVPRRRRDFKGFIGHLYVYYGVWFGFGALITAAVTHTLKITVSRLRPHFFSLCQPDFAALEPLCSRNVYIVDYNCTNPNISPHYFHDMLVSFPSSHASFGFHAAVFIVLYLQRRWTSTRGTVALRPFLQILPVLAAAMIGVSRVNDFKHFASDVVAGACLGSIVALFSFFAIGSKPLYQIYANGEDYDSNYSSSSSSNRETSVEEDVYSSGSLMGRCREVNSGEFGLTDSGKVGYNTFGSKHLLVR